MADDRVVLEVVIQDEGAQSLQSQGGPTPSGDNTGTTPSARRTRSRSNTRAAVEGVSSGIVQGAAASKARKISDAYIAPDLRPEPPRAPRAPTELTDAEIAFAARRAADGRRSFLKEFDAARMEQGRLSRAARAQNVSTALVAIRGRGATVGATRFGGSLIPIGGGSDLIIPPGARGVGRGGGGALVSGGSVVARGGAVAGGIGTAGVVAAGAAAAAALAGVALAARAATTGLRDIETARGFSGRVAGAVAGAEAREIVGNIRRAREVEAELAELVRTQSRLNEAQRDFETNIQETFLPLATQAISQLATIIQVGNALIDAAQKVASVSDVLPNALKEKFGLDLSTLNPSISGINQTLLKLASMYFEWQATQEEEDAFAEFDAFFDPVRARARHAAGELFNEAGPRR